MLHPNPLYMYKSLNILDFFNLLWTLLEKYGILCIIKEVYFMKILLDTNIIIHREANKIINDDIGILFNWLDKLKYEKYIHPLTIQEIEKHENEIIKKTMLIKIQNYNVLKTLAPINQTVQSISDRVDVVENDVIDTKILNEVYEGRINYLISEDNKIHIKAKELGISEKVYKINSFLEKVTSENPKLSDYKTLSVKKDFFGNINVDEDFFESFRSDYDGFKTWFNRKSDEIAYVCRENSLIKAFLYVKTEDIDENYQDIAPAFERKKRLKIGTFKVELNGYKLGERFVKIIFDNAIQYNVDEIYVTIFENNDEQKRLIDLLKEFGFYEYGTKNSSSGIEKVYVRQMHTNIDLANPKMSYPYIPKNTNFFIVPIYPEYHTELFPDSILNNESADDFVENRPHRNSISKVYISRAIERNILKGDVLIFYRTGGYYKSVVTTIGIVEDIDFNIGTEQEFIDKCRKRSVFSNDSLIAHWRYKPAKPFIVKFTVLYSFPTRINMATLININALKGIDDAPRGFKQISKEAFEKITDTTNSNKSIFIDNN